ncbi:hypothetical protein [Gemmatimonas sp.]|uniref:hypothetical protein n=1 Tax=Gemmatimonas sp. TaxID=1962908 RepID=UPI003DA26972
MKVSPDDFADSFRLLQQEGALFRSCLCSGFSLLKHANPGDKGAYYSAFFQLSIGIERMMKLVFIVRHMADNDLAAPTRADVRKLGHDLSEIYRTLRLDISEASETDESSVHRQILGFFTEFATSTRYHNLDALTNGKPTRDPLDAYNRLFLRIVSDDLDRRLLQQISSQSRAMAEALEDIVGVIGHGLDGRLISLPNAFMLGPLHAAGTPLVIWRIYELLAPVRDALDSATDDAQQTNWRVIGGTAAIPFMNEFQDFLWNDREGVLEQNEWP